ncbi:MULTISPECIES: hypothetical protein [Photobacterium]|uniref:hypothetical protein n=1 Tax=Photobacterium TaxID=657 RepID=UPI000D182190|nr:hypothetical protein [Photobacterium phosphoreum]PSU31827.1 hypothetical protein CTM85_20365 [Photobacterium phosphoreum]
MVINSWYNLNTSLFEMTTQDKKEKFTTYLSPYFVPKAYRYNYSKDKQLIIEFKYIDIAERTNKITHLENHKVYFEVGDKTRRIYKVYIGQINLLDSEVEKAFSNLANQLNNENKELYLPAINVTKICLSGKINVLLDT